jgi:hypothetical protein
MREPSCTKAVRAALDAAISSTVKRLADQARE